MAADSSSSMTPERWRLLTAIFHEALDCDASARAAFVDQACAGDAEIRGEVVRLLAAHQRAGAFGEAAVVDVAGASGEDIASHPERSTQPRTPFIWVVGLATAVVTAMFSYAAWQLFQEGGAAADVGWLQVRQGSTFTVLQVNPDGPAAGRLQAGDRILALNGLPPVLPGGFALHRSELSVGDSYSLTVERQTQRIEATLAVAAGSSQLRTRLTYFFMSLVWCVIGLFMGFAAPHRPAARLAFASAVTTGLVFSQGALSRALFSFNPLHVVLGFHFFARFPAERPLSRIWKWVVILACGLAAGLMALQGWVRVVRESQGASAAIELVLSHQPLFALRGTIPLYLFYASLAGMVTMAVGNYRRLSSEDERRRVRWVAYGSIVALTPQIVWSIGAVLFGGPAMVWIAIPADVMTVVIPLAVAYAVVKHRVLDIRVAVRRGAQYVLATRALQAAIAVPGMALIYTVFRYRDQTIAALVTDTSAYLYWLAAAGLVLRFRGPIQSWLDRRFFRQAQDREALVLDLVEDVRKVESIAELSQLVHDTVVSALHPSSVYVWYREPDERAGSSAAPLMTPPDFPVGGRWLSWLEQRGQATPLPQPDGAELDRRDMRWFARHAISLAVPMIDGSDRLVGVLLLGDRKSEEQYSDDDRRLLDAVARQAAVVRENLRLRARVGEDARIRHDVLARLDQRIPDLLKECPACGTCFDGLVERCDRDGRALTLSLPVARTVDGKYRLDRLLGKGGMGAVYEARDLRLDRSVAVKILLGRAFGELAALSRFRREAQATARLNHANIVRVYDYGSLEGEGAYLVMELVRGETLRAALARAYTLTPAAAADWFGPLLDGTAAAHAHGIIHRDLKPENVMGQREASGSLAVKILDLGLAKVQRREGAATATLTAEGLVMGTPAYMSPEQLLGRDLDHRTDIFAVGVMLAEALTGSRPSPEGRCQLPGSSPEARAISDLLQRCLAADLRDRVSSAAGLRDELIPLLRTYAPPPGA